MSENLDRTKKTQVIHSPFRADEESPYIFISYAHADRDRIFPIIKELYEKGWRIWYDEGLPIGKNYYEQLAAHIRNCAVMVLFVTKNSVASPFVTENELEFGIKAKKRIIFCRLDDNAVLPDGIELATANETKHPRTDVAGLEAVLASIEGLTPTDPRKAVGITINSPEEAITSDEDGEYNWKKISIGVILKKYKGSDTEVVVPAEYPAGSGQPVVEIDQTFWGNSNIRTVQLPETIMKIRFGSFAFCYNLHDVYIPSRVSEIVSGNFDGSKNLTIHCAKNSAAHVFAEKENIPFVIDDDMAVTEFAGNHPASSYAYCSYAPGDIQRAAEIMEGLKLKDCTLLDGGKIAVEEKIGAMHNASCFIALVSSEYIDSHHINDLRFVSATSKEIAIYILEDCVLPADVDIVSNSVQQLRFDSYTEEERTTKLAEWLQNNSCRKVSADIEDFEYTATSEGITLIKYTGVGGDVVIKSKHGGIRITAIGESAFWGCSGLSSITIPAGVTRIGSSAFWGCSGLSSVTIPAGVTEIGSSAFWGCSELSSIKADHSNTSFCDVDGVLFSQDKSILIQFPQARTGAYTIPAGVTRIGHDAFSGCSGLSSVTIPAGVTVIGESAFYRCSGLTSITVDPSNTSYTDVDGVLFSKDKSILIKFPQARIETYAIPDGVTEISSSAFEDCSELSSVTIPAGITEIGIYAFSGCSGLSSITIPAGVTKIGSSAFWGCSGLSSITIPAGVTEIGIYAFSGCSGLSSVTIPAGVTEIGEYAFEDCSELASVIISADVAKIGWNAFSGCSGLSSVTIPDSVIEIDVDAFSGCTNLTVYCPEDSYAWQFCEVNNINHAAAPEAPTPARKFSRALGVILAILLALVAAGAIVQLTGFFDILGLLGNLLG